MKHAFTFFTWAVAAFFGSAGSRILAQYYPPPGPYSYGNAYISTADPYGGNLYGSASVINASGKLMLDTQNAYLMQEQVKQSKLDTKRKNFDEWKYEQANTPTNEELRAKSRQQQLQRSMVDPPLTEIWSAKALNDLLLDLQLMQNSHVYAPTAVLDPALLKRINVSTGMAAGSVGLLREDGRLTWPLALQDRPFDLERKKIEQLVPQAIKQAKVGPVQASVLRDLINTVNKLGAKLKQNVADIPSMQYIEAKRYVTQLDDATKVLQDPNVSNFFNSKWVARGSNVTELVRYMTDQGLKFAPATSGDETYYTALHRALANYDSALHQQLARR